MKILSLHVDYINFKPLKKALKQIGALSEIEKKGKKVKESLVILTAVEKGDSIKDSVKELVKNIKDIAKKVGIKSGGKIVLYPYAHLSSNLASPELAVGVLEKAEKELKKNFMVVRAPFGYYKEFELKVKGHPLSESSREFRFEEEDVREIDSRNLLKSMGKSILDRSKLKSYDHRIIGQDMDLFSFNEVAPGSVFWHNNGFIIYNTLIDFMRGLLKDFEYQEISTPQILDNKLWKVSGHWRLYKENMFLTEYENKDAAIKPMNCPGAMLVYRARPRSYKELPVRLAEMGVVHRKELSGVLGGLFRVVKMTQDDAHIFCTEKQLELEIINVIKLFKKLLDKFNFKYRFTISVRSKEKKEKYLGDDKLWKSAEEALANGLKKLKLTFNREIGEAKFYGPSLDVQIKDSLGREWQCSTLQLDFNLPERFGLEYIGKDNKRHTPIVLHRVVYGSLERFIGILLEHTKGRLPTWLAPVQVRVLSFTSRNEEYAKAVIKQIGEKIPDLRLDADFRSTTIPTKVKEAEMMRIPWTIITGDKEEKNKTISVRHMGKVKYGVKLGSFIKELKRLIEERK